MEKKGRERTREEKTRAKRRECELKMPKHKWKDKSRQSEACVTQNLRYKERKEAKITSLPTPGPITLCHTEQRWGGKEQGEENNTGGGEVYLAHSSQLQG